MTLTKKLLATLLLLPLSSQAVTMAIIDSGTDMEHEMITPYVWMNEKDSTENNRDEDRNGYQDDIYGWNFAETNNMVIDYKYLGLLNDDIRKFFGIQTKMFLGTASSEEIKWVKTMVSNEDFIKRISTYGNFMHGTHVAGIAVKDLQITKMLAVKVIPTEVKLPGQKNAELSVEEKGLGEKIVKFGLKQLAKAQMTQMEEIAAYVDGHKVDIANGSFGTGFNQAKMIVETVLVKLLKRKVSKEEIEKYAVYFLEQLIINGKKMSEAAPNTLFVFAAGNDGSNNDIYPTSPTNIDAHNVISVAAALGFNSLAPFSNYGEKTVDVAAPGVSINSAVPGNQYLQVSGTSQAAPYIANVAARIKEINKGLKPVQIKKIIMETVDKRDWLVGKVKTSGIVNSERAFVAANLSLNVSVEEALEEAKILIKDGSELRINIQSQFVEGMIRPLPSSFKM